MALLKSNTAYNAIKGLGGFGGEAAGIGKRLGFGNKAITGESFSSMEKNSSRLRGMIDDYHTAKAAKPENIDLYRKPYNEISTDYMATNPESLRYLNDKNASVHYSKSSSENQKRFWDIDPVVPPEL